MRSFDCRVLAWALFLASGALAAPAPNHSTYEVKESHSVPSKWTKVGKAPGHHTVSLQIAVKQSRFDELEKHLLEVSDPDHSRYGQHLSPEEVSELIKPTDRALNDIHAWLAEHGIDAGKLSHSPAKDWINVDLPVELLEKLLDTEFSVYEHDDGGAVVRAPEYSLPKHLHDHIETIQPTNSFFRAKALKTTVKPVGKAGKVDAHALVPQTQFVAGQTVADVCNVTNVTPLCLRTLYGTIDYKPQAAGKNQIGLTNYLGEVNNRSDVGIFLQMFRPDAAGQEKKFKTIVIANGSNQQTPENSTQLDDGTDLEGNLDAETILSIGYPTPLTTYNTGGSPPFVPDAVTTTDTNEPYLTWLQYVSAAKSIPQVISTSYGDDEQTVPLAYAQRVCNGFAALGARGVSLLFSSGDNGVGNDGDCFTNDGKNTSTFLPSFPPSCPYVTVVGATKNFAPEVVAVDASNGFSSGGGFSNYFSRPSYQNTVVPAYVKALAPQFAYPGLYNKSGRAYPDIAAQGQRYAVVWNGTLVHLDGTSASSPCAASVLTLVNDALIAAGKSPLGFMNPWLYKTGYKGFTDVTSGATLGCNGTGFPAAKGWDPATGFGTPNFPKLKTLALGAKSGYGRK